MTFYSELSLIDCCMLQLAQKIEPMMMTQAETEEVSLEVLEEELFLSQA